MALSVTWEQAITQLECMHGPVQKLSVLDIQSDGYYNSKHWYTSSHNLKNPEINSQSSSLALGTQKLSVHTNLDGLCGCVLLMVLLAFQVSCV